MINSSEKRIAAAKAQNLLREYNDFLLMLMDETRKELDIPITGNTTDEIALQYMKREGGREALTNFMRRINSKANE